MSTQYILANSIDLLYVVSDYEANIVRSNDLFKEYSSHIKPKKVSDIISDDTELDDYVQSVKRAIEITPNPVRIYARTKQKNSGLRWVLWNCYAILGSLHFVGFQITDVTSITSHEHEKQKQLLEEFRFMLSHELRQPLTSVAGVVKLLLDKGGNIGDQEQNELLKMVDDSMKRLDESIHLLVKKATRQL
jgi:signal transduction histidine kinase